MLVYTSESGAEGDTIEHPTTNQNARYVVLQEVSAGETIPPGAYDGQPVKWDGADYVPLPIGQFLIYRGVTDETGLSVLNLDMLAVGLTSDADGAVLTLNSAGAGGTTNVSSQDTTTIQGQTVNVQSPAGALYRADAPGAVPTHTFWVDAGAGDPMLQMVNGQLLAFFGVAPVARQSITGATAQLQIDSLVAALAALGLVTDDR